MIGTISFGSTYTPYTGDAGMQSGCLNWKCSMLMLFNKHVFVVEDVGC